MRPYQILFLLPFIFCSCTPKATVTNPKQALVAKELNYRTLPAAITDIVLSEQECGCVVLDSSGLVMNLDYNPWEEVRKDFLLALYTQIWYPTDARNNKIQGTVLIGMEIDEAGEIQETFIGKGLLASMDREALYATRRAAQKIKFSPAKQDGALVPITLVFPVTFKLK